MSRAVGGMARGMWQEAGAALAGIGRRSPLPRGVFFCKTMVGYEAGDDLSVLRALDAIPEGHIQDGVGTRLSKRTYGN